MTEAPVPRPPAGPAAGTPAAAPANDRTAQVEELLDGLDDLAGRPVAEHHDRLAEVHEALHRALNEPPAG